jgi:hypothetical protein
VIDNAFGLSHRRKRALDCFLFELCGADFQQQLLAQFSAWKILSITLLNVENNGMCPY